MGDQIDIDLLKIFGLLHCRGTIRRKAHFFYGLLQKGGEDKFQFISAGDKDFVPNFEKLCLIASWGLFAATIQIGTFDELYSAEETEKLKT